MNSLLMPRRVAQSPERHAAHRAVIWFVSQMSYSDMFLQVESLAPRRSTDVALE